MGSAITSLVLHYGKEIVNSPAEPQVESDNDFFLLSTATSKMSLDMSSSLKMSLRCSQSMTTLALTLGLEKSKNRVSLTSWVGMSALLTRPSSSIHMLRGSPC